MSTAASPLDYRRLEQLITRDRLTSYLESSDGDLRQAFALYDWNVEASAAVLSLAAMVEVILRNALDREMTAWARARTLTDWLDGPPLDERGLDDIAKARSRAARSRRPSTHGHVVAELNLGFWRYLVSKKYLTTLWIPHLANAFPDVSGDPQAKRIRVESDTQQLLFLRNRAAHHEPIHRRDLLMDLRRGARLVAGVHPTAKTWVESRERVSTIVEQRPGRDR